MLSALTRSFTMTSSFQEQEQARNLKARLRTQTCPGRAAEAIITTKQTAIECQEKRLHAAKRAECARKGAD